MKKAHSAGGIVVKINKDSKEVLLLLVRHEDGFLVFPKGHIDNGETKEEAALREVKEETGLTGLQITTKLGVVVRPSIERNGEQVEKTIDLFLMQTNNYQHNKADEDYDWFTYGEAIKGLGFEQERQFLKERLIEIIHFSLKDEDWISPKTKIKKSVISGKGLYAIKPIKKGDLVVVWGGDYVGSDEARKAQDSGKLVLQWDENLFSVEDRGESVGYFVNHSCEPNLYMQGTYALIAMRDIEKGEELTADYALWEADESYVSKWDCNCGSTKCRKKVTGKDWRLPELQEKYKGHFSPLINKRIEQQILKR